MRFLWIAVCLVWALPAWAQPLKVVTTTTIIADFVRQVGGDDVEVVSLVGPNADAHMFEPGPADVARLKGADLLVMNGLGLEGWMTRLVQSSDYKGSVLIAARDVLPRKSEVDGAQIPDPHAWQDVRAARNYVMSINLGLRAIDPAHGDKYRERAAAYDRVLSELNRWIKDQIDQVPKAKRAIITSHDAFGYFADAYGLKVYSVHGLSTESEPSAEYIAELVEKVRSTGVKAVFLENMSETKSAETLAKDAGAIIGGTLYVDALSTADGPAPNYVAMMRYNVPLLRDAMLKNQ